MSACACAHERNLVWATSPDFANVGVTTHARTHALPNPGPWYVLCACGEANEIELTSTSTDTLLHGPSSTLAPLVQCRSSARLASAR